MYSIDRHAHITICAVQSCLEHNATCTSPGHSAVCLFAPLGAAARTCEQCERGAEASQVVEGRLADTIPPRVARLGPTGMALALVAKVVAAEARVADALGPVLEVEHARAWVRTTLPYPGAIVLTMPFGAVPPQPVVERCLWCSALVTTL